MSHVDTFSVPYPRKISGYDLQILSTIRRLAISRDKQIERTFVKR